MEVEVAAVAESCVAHDALVDEAEAFVEVTRTGIVLEDVEEKTMRVEIFEGQLKEIGEDFAPQATPRCRHYDAFDLECAGVLAQPAQDDVGLEVADGRVSYKIAGVAAGEGSAMTFLTPLAYERLSARRALQGNDAGDVIFYCGS